MYNPCNNYSREEFNKVLTITAIKLHYFFLPKWFIYSLIESCFNRKMTFLKAWSKALLLNRSAVEYLIQDFLYIFLNEYVFFFDSQSPLKKGLSFDRFIWLLLPFTTNSTISQVRKQRISVDFSASNMAGGQKLIRLRKWDFFEK